MIDLLLYRRTIDIIAVFAIGLEHDLYLGISKRHYCICYNPGESGSGLASPFEPADFDEYKWRIAGAGAEYIRNLQSI